MFLVRIFELIVSGKGGGGVNNPGVGLFAFIVLFEYNIAIIR